MAEKLGLGTEPRKLRLGESFSKNGHTAFHTFRYDFKPASMDTKKMATVQIGPNNQTTVQVPHVEGSGTSHTIFKGPRKPYTKECVLIIDHATGEIVLEKLSSNVQLKKTRAEGGAKFQPRPMTPVEQTNSKKASPPQKHSPNNLRPPHSPVQRTSPNQTSPYQRSPTSLSQKSPANQRSPSMPNLVPPTGTAKPNSFVSSMPLLASDFIPVAAVPVPETVDEASEVGILTDSSNESSSSGGSSSSGSESSDEESEKKDRIRKPISSVENATSNSQYSSSNLPPSMPRFSQLSEDLHLSESESDG